MKKVYKDARSLRNWLKQVEDSQDKTAKVTFITLSSLTPEKISDLIHEHYEHPDYPNFPDWLVSYDDDNKHRITSNDANDMRLISILLYVIDRILTSQFYDSDSFDKDSGGVTVSVDYLRKLLYDDATVIRHALHVGWMTRIFDIASESYSGDTGNKSNAGSFDGKSYGKARSYRIHPEHYMAPHNYIEIVDCPSAFIAKKVFNRRKSKNSSSLRFNGDGKGKVYVTSFFNVCSLKVDYDAALATLKAEYDAKVERLTPNLTKCEGIEGKETMLTVKIWYYSAISSLLWMASEEYQSKFLKIDDYGRVHTNLTNFPRILRQFLSFDGCPEPMAMVDLANAQPFLLVFLIMELFSFKTGKKIETRKQLDRYCMKAGLPDVMKYVTIVENGDFYNECYRLFRGNKKLKTIKPAYKEQMREMIYTSLFFGDGKTKWRDAQKLKKRFRREYPTVFNIIMAYKKQDYKSLPKLLQQEESKLFINDILTKLVVRDSLPFILSLHDGIFCPVSSVEAVLERFKHSFAKSQLRPTVKVDNYGTGESYKKQFNV